jgi:hypothetical protein
MLGEYCWKLIRETPSGEYEAKEEDIIFNDDFLFVVRKSYVETLAIILYCLL